MVGRNSYVNDPIGSNWWVSHEGQPGYVLYCIMLFFHPTKAILLRQHTPLFGQIIRSIGGNRISGYERFVAMVLRRLGLTRKRLCRGWLSGKPKGHRTACHFGPGTWRQIHSRETGACSPKALSNVSPTPVWWARQSPSDEQSI